MLFANANKQSTKWRRCDDLSLHHLIPLQHQNTQLCSTREKPLQTMVDGALVDTCTRAYKIVIAGVDI
jgi:hypothetical protein